jgi:hypothetical protein
MSSAEQQRWYDRDPALRQALNSLRQAPDRYQAQIALNLILIIIEHQIESRTLGSVDDLVHTIEDSKNQTKNYYRRWYDVNETLRSAIQLLHDCPEDVQTSLIPAICKMVEESLNGLSL